MLSFTTFSFFVACEEWGAAFSLQNWQFLLNFAVVFNRLAGGELAERLKAPVLKTGEGSPPPRVRISHSPPFSFFPRHFRELKIQKTFRDHTGTIPL